MTPAAANTAAAPALAAHLRGRAECALERLRAAGFDAARAEASVRSATELNVQHDAPSLMRGTEIEKLSIAGLLDGRLATAEVADLSDAAIDAAARALFDDVRAAPQDDANAITAGQTLQQRQGPGEPDPAAMAARVAELLDFRTRETPSFRLTEASLAHERVDACLLSTGGSRLERTVGAYALQAFGNATDGRAASSFNGAGGTLADLGRPLADELGLAAMLRDGVRQVRTVPLAEPFVGDVVLAPAALAAVLGWLLGQLGDAPLVSGTSVYRDAVGRAIASPAVTLTSRFDGPGLSPLSADGFVAPPLALLREGRLMHLTPSLYGSRKTGLPHVPVAPAGWEMAAGDTPLDALVAGVPRGALVNRLSFGNPNPAGDFSGLVKNSFLIEGGVPGAALRETMIAGNVARMLENVVAVSRERIDTGGWWLPWVRVSGLNFS